tara:strand:- start:3910 stop:4626 length:717 start_codon:yes stop_codon:yes gene_type:complete
LFVLCCRSAVRFQRSLERSSSVAKTNVIHSVFSKKARHGISSDNGIRDQLPQRYQLFSFGLPLSLSHFGRLHVKQLADCDLVLGFIVLAAPVVLRNAVGDRDWSKVFGAATEQEVASIVKKSASQGLQSQFGDALGAFFRARSTLANGNFQQGSRAAKLYKAIQSEATSFERNPVGTILSHRPYLQQLYQSSGLNKVAAEQATNFIGDTVGNRQYLNQNPRTASIVRPAKEIHVAGLL